MIATYNNREKSFGYIYLYIILFIGVVITVYNKIKLIKNEMLGVG